MCHLAHMVHIDMKRFACIAVLLLNSLIVLAQQFTSVPGQGRSMVVTKFGIVSTPQFLASQAGAHILEEGGNAIDAAIGANAVMGVVQPYVNGIGGDLFMLYYESKTGKLYGLNSSGWAPKALTIDYLKSKGITEMNPIGAETIDIPGAVAGWDAMRTRFGTLPFSQLLAPAIYYAQNGFPLAERNARYWIAKSVLNQPGYKETYDIWSSAPKPGDLFKNPALANSLRQIAEHGRDAFYNGPMTETMVKFLDAHGGTHTPEDFRDFQPEWVEPVSTTYRGWTVYELPPNGQGIAALSMLNIMEHFPLSQYGHNSVDALHVMIEAKKLAYADMYKYVGDPRFTPIPVKELISKDLADKRAKLIDMKKAACQVVPSEISAELDKHGNSTIYLSTIDKDGNVVSLIQSNYAGYGTGLVARDSAFPSRIAVHFFNSLLACPTHLPGTSVLFIPSSRLPSGCAHILANEASFDIRSMRLASRLQRPLNVDELRERDKTELDKLGTAAVMAAAEYVIRNEETFDESVRHSPRFKREIFSCCELWQLRRRRGA